MRKAIRLALKQQFRLSIVALLITVIFFSWPTVFNIMWQDVKLGNTPDRTVDSRTQQQHGTWIGNIWIPPPGRHIYSAAEMKLFFQKHSVLFIGDSTARRAYATLYGILQSSETHISVQSIDSPDVIDVNKWNGAYKETCNKPSMDLCQTVPGTSMEDRKYFDYRKLNCLRHIVNFAKEQHAGNITKDYSLIIVSLGVWETVKKKDCLGDLEMFFPNATYAYLTDALEAMSKLQDSSTTVVWRTSGFVDEDSEGNTVLKEMNQRVIRHIHSLQTNGNDASNITYVDWGSEIAPRSIGGDRIQGDMPAHYGLEARLLFLQLLMNELDKTEIKTT